MTTLHERRQYLDASLIGGIIRYPGGIDFLDKIAPEELTHQAASDLLRCQAIRADRGEVTETEWLRADGLDMERYKVLRDCGESHTTLKDRLEGCRAMFAAERSFELLSAGQRALKDGAANAESLRDTIAPIREGLGTIVDSLEPEVDRNSFRAVTETLVERLPMGDLDAKFTSGVPDWDARVDGMVAGTVHCIIARTGHGKSSFGVTAALAAATQGQRVLYVSTEMNERELALRFHAAIQGTTRREVMGLGKSDPAFRETMLEASGLPLVLECRLKHVDSIVGAMDSAYRRERPFGLIVLDYLQQLVGPGDSQAQQLEGIAYGIHNAAVRTDGVVIVLAQMNRAGAVERGTIPQTEDIRGSTAVGNAMDTVTGMVRLDSIGGGMGYPVKFAVRKARNAEDGPLSGQYHLGAGTYLISQVRSENANVVAREAIR